jgi:glutaminyl-peptide cyclotransferase
MIPFYTSLLSGIVLSLLISCNGRNAHAEHFSIAVNSNKKTIQLNDTLKIHIKSDKKFTLDSIAVELAGNTITATGNSVVLPAAKTGKQDVKAVVFYDGKTESLKKTITILANVKPKVYTYKIINTYPHDSKAYTQGLEFCNDTLYESTGGNGKSTLRKIDYKTGAILKSVKLDNAYFGEGITILNDKLYLLTWQSGKGFVYDLKTLSPLSSFAYGKSKEGWGLCNDSKKIYKSDGTEKIWILNPETLEEEAHIQIVSNSSLFSKTNELEYANGKIYANSYPKDGVMLINPENGSIEGVIDFRRLKEKVTQHQELDVLNGIAYHPRTKTFFITGKNWDKLFEVEIIEK